MSYHWFNRKEILQKAKEKLFGQKLQHISNDAFQSYNDLFQVN